MVASFPEFDYRTRRSQSNYKAGCVPSVHIQSKPSKLKLDNSTLRPAATQDAADSTTVLRKLLSFHGSFSSNHSNRRAESLLEDPNQDSRPAAQIALLGDRASNFLGKKNSAAHMGDEPNAVLAASQNIDRKEFNLDSRQGNAGKSGEFASKTRRKWSSFKAARLHSSGQDSKLGTQNGYALFRRRGQCQTPRECQAAENVDSTRTAPKCSAGLHVDALSARGQDESQSLKCDLKEVANPATNVKTEYTVQNSYLDAQVGDIGAQKCTPHPVDSSNVASSVTVQDVDGHNASCERSSNAGREQANCENSRKVSSSATGVHNFTCSSENPLYASDNSSNNMRWSSTSCASTDTSSSNSTRRSSCESRTSTVPSSLSFTSHAKPHKVHDATWAAIHNLQLHNGGAPLSIGHFRLVRRVGHGDIGSVFLAHLKEKAVASPSDISCLFAIKVMDKDALSLRNKLHRMHMEKEILESVDHPFLPTLYAHFDSEHYSCLVMDYCPGGDLYALRQKQPGKRFGLLAARFYAAEVLLALEYLHMLGIVYRDLKPENVLVREDGHIMLTDFDLSLKCDVKPQLLKHPLLSSSSLLMSASLSSTLLKRRLMRSHSQSSTMSSSSTMSTFLHHGSTNGTMPVACSMDPIVSCLSLSNTNSRKAQHFQKHQASATALSNMVGSDTSNASCMTGPLTSSFRDRSVVEPLQLSKEDVCCAELVALAEKSSDGEHAKVARRGTIAEYDKNDADHNNKGTERASTSGLGCQEDHMVFMELVAEPTQARSMSFVGTHEYLAPEIIAGHGHGSQVDWWTLGIFVYELLFGKTPFKGASNDQTLINIIRQQLRFPEMSEGEFEDARSLIGGLLVKDPRRRLGCTKGAAEIKQHPFFKGVNWALIRCTQPPEMPCKQLSRRQVNNPTSYHHIHRQIYQTAAKSLHHFDVF